MKTHIQSNNQQANVQFKLANIWYVQKKFDAAITGYQRALHFDPGFAPAYIKLGAIMLSQGDVQQAIKYYEKAIEIEPEDKDVLFIYTYLNDLLNGKEDMGVRQTPVVQKQNEYQIKDNPRGKINLYNQKTFKCHRSGWDYVLGSLKSLHNGSGILFDGFIENNFAWKHWSDEVRPDYVLEKMKYDGTFEAFASSEEKGITPYREPWVGFIHNPQGMPQWFRYHESPQAIFAKNIWKESLKHCLGFFTFSEYNAEWLRTQTGKPVSILVHPTEFPDLIFDFERFKKNPQKKIIQIGWWLRQLNAIYQLPIPKNNLRSYEKIRLVPLFFGNAHEYLKELMARERDELNIKINPLYAENTREIIHVSNQEYDELLSENIVFVNLYDANANNAVIECIARATPLLINPIPAVVEYLGKDYPMYFTNLEDAAEKALDASLILETHNYLKNSEIRKKITREYFVKSFEESAVYRLI